MEDIKVMPKPDWVSWDDIHELLYAAHAKNREKGITMYNAIMSGDELKKKVGDGLCVVALDGDKLVGVTAVEMKQKRKWYLQGKKVAHKMLSAILPSYQGIGIREDMDILIWKWIKNSDVEVVWGGTAENNTIVRKIVRKNGFVEVDYIAPVKADYYSVVFVKWMKGCPYSSQYCNFRFKWSRFWTRLRYKPGKKERFKIVEIGKKIIRKIKRSRLFRP